MLITLCVRCHLRVHRWRWFRHQAPALLVQLWTELHGEAPVQLPLEAASETRRQGKLNAWRYEELELFAPKSMAWRKAFRYSHWAARNPPAGPPIEPG